MTQSIDLSFLEALVPDLAGAMGLSPSTLLLYVILGSTAANIAGRLIPDDVTGPLGSLRDLFKILGGYVSNRVSSGVSVSQVASSIVSETDPKVLEAAKDNEALIPQVTDEPAAKVVPAFPGFVRPQQEDSDETNFYNDGGDPPLDRS